MKKSKKFFRTSLKYSSRWEPESDTYFLGKKAMLIGRQLHRDIVNSVNPRDSTLLDLGAGKGRMVCDYVRAHIKQ